MTEVDHNCILRYATGITLCLALAFGVGWTLSNIAPILTGAFLGSRGPRPNIKATLSILLAIVIIFGAGLFATIYLYHYPLVFLLLFSTAIYLNFYMAAGGASGLVVLLCTLAILLLPLIGGPKPWLALEISTGFFLSALIALVCTQVAHTLFPGGTAAAATRPEAGDPGARVESAWLSTAVVLPLALLCLVFNLTGAVLPLIMVAMLSQKPDFSTGAAGGKALVAANLGGGLVAIIFFQLLKISPTLPFLLTGFFALALMFGRGLFSDRPAAPLFGSAFNTVLILVGSSTGYFSSGAESEFYQRIGLILLAVLYVVGALSLLEGAGLRERWMRAGRWLSVKIAR